MEILGRLMLVVGKIFPKLILKIS